MSHLTPESSHLVASSLHKSKSMIEHDKICTKNEFTNGIDRHAADKFEIHDFVDLTDDYKCFICDEIILHTFYSLVKTITNISKTDMARKLGEIVGKSCIVVVSEDDYICQNCVNLFNQLDNLENQLKNVKSNIMKHLEQTYFNKEKN